MASTSARTPRGAPLPLEGVRVLGLEQLIAGPCTTMFLADAGAEVVKVEPPGGESARALGPFAEANGTRYSGFYARFNRGKRVVTADISTPDGVATVRDLIAEADVFVENLKPGRLKACGLDYESVREIRPDIVYCSVTGFGVDPDARGPYSDWPAFDIAVQAMGGLMNMCGTDPDGPPVYSGFGISDFGTSVFAANAVLQALFRRERTGKGAWLDVSMYDSTVWFNERAMAHYAFTGESLVRGKPSLAAPWGSFATADGYVALIVPSDGMWRKLCAAMGREDLAADERLSTGAGRVRERDTVVHPAVGQWTREHTSQDIVDTLIAAGVPCGRVQNAEEIAACPQVAARGLLWELEGDVPDGAFAVGSPVRFVGETAQPVPAVPALPNAKEAM